MARKIVTKKKYSAKAEAEVQRFMLLCCLKSYLIHEGKIEIIDSRKKAQTA